MTGDAPQPGETPRTEGNPWSFDPDAAWWRGDGDREQAEALAEAAARPRHPRRRQPSNTPASAAFPLGHGDADADVPFLGETVDAHAAGAHDAAQAMTPAAAPAAKEPAATIEGVPDAAVTDAEPVAVERDHDKRTRSRFQPPEPPDEPAWPEQQDQQERQEYVEPAPEPDPEDEPEDVPDVMVLPEPDPDRNRPTVPLERGPLERGPVPGQSAGVPLNQARTTAAELDVKRARMENSPFWLTDEERAAAGGTPFTPETRSRRAEAPGPADGRRGLPPRTRPRSPRRAAPGLIGLIALGLIAAFFSWVSAEPFWLAVGHGERGVATVARCTGDGVTQRCAGSFAGAAGDYRVQRVTLLGVDPANRYPGAAAPARMVNPGSTQAYVGSTGVLLHLRWVLGFVLVLLCGLGIAGLTGTRQLETLRARRAALLMSVIGPVLLLAGFLFAAY